MSSPGYPKGGGDYTKYVDYMMGLVGDEDPLEIMAGQSARLREAISGQSDEALRRRPQPDKWSAAEVVGHLLDSELVYGYRVRNIVAEDRPAIAGYDQDLWTARLEHNDADIDEMLGTLEAMRSYNLRFLAALSDAELDRVGLHNERGEESVRHIIRLLAGHDLNHLRQLREALSADS